MRHYSTTQREGKMRRSGRATLLNYLEGGGRSGRETLLKGVVVRRYSEEDGF